MILSTWLSSQTLLRLLQRLLHLLSLQQLVLRLQHLNIALDHHQQLLQRLHQSSIAYNASLERILSTSCLQSVLLLSQCLLSLQNTFQSLLHQLLRLLHLSLLLL
jgi:hypothetical protein